MAHAQLIYDTYKQILKEGTTRLVILFSRVDDYTQMADGFRNQATDPVNVDRIIRMFDVLFFACTRATTLEVDLVNFAKGPVRMVWIVDDPEECAQRIPSGLNILSTEIRSPK